ncbi:hypothetical protein M409DRAFT_65793 [Zasmidium cellare ATCC 36951]|uniref:Major facilitator superfamily (MFS) profile domain-containing protein n=1 Tax=Zasmidium cellare ATCC 36951 TaxID=1080233 RepID=A0A6A6CKA4_ZASCE|nr:uncharacterized protein M409DRAFT_65793 [Zasmidium cellare ATCC 36951]KAF2167654.1 hypothetical protein M409DRAFT_65793 [Zasmidium cellare ATCC 36951]
MKQSETQQVENEAANIVTDDTWRIEALIKEMEHEDQANPQRPGRFEFSPKSSSHMTWFIAACSSMGGLLFGLDQSLISGANLFYRLVNAAMPLGAVGGAILLIPSNEYLGRRKAIILSTILYTVGAALQAGAFSYGSIVAGRVVMGLGVGIETGTVPVYVAETVESRLRGNLVSLYQFNIALGEVFGYVVAAIFLHVRGNWRFMLGSSILFSTAMFLGMLILPESPRHLMHKNKTLQAFRVWKRLRDITSPESRQEFFLMKEAVGTVASQMQEKKNTARFVWLDFVTVPRARRAIIYANIMILLGQFVGINGIMYYMGVLMTQIGFSEANSTYMSLVGGVSLFLGTIPAIFYMERFGRRFWALTMLPGFLIGLVITGISYLFSPVKQVQAAEGLYLTGLIVYMAFYGPYACLTWVIPSEVYPTYLRSYGMATSDGMVFLGSFIITYNFTSMQEAMTKTGLTLGFFGGIALLGWFYQLLFMPETRNLKLEEIDAVFSLPTRELVRRNWKSSVQTASNMVHCRRASGTVDSGGRLGGQND